MITNGKVVSMHYVLKNSQGTIVDDSTGAEPLTYLHGSQNIVPGLEAGLNGLKKGDKKDVKVSAKDGYGEHNPEMIMDVARTQFPADAPIEVGMQFQATSPEGYPVIFTVMEIGASSIKVDGNHPLAGQDLFFTVEITDVRDATKEETQHGHVHGAGGHHH